MNKSLILLPAVLALFGVSAALAGVGEHSRDIKSIVLNEAAYKAERASGGARIKELFSAIEAQVSGPGALSSIDDAALAALSDAAIYVSIFRNDAAFISIFENIFSELEKRGKGNREAAGYLQLAYIDAHLFDKARAIDAKYPQYDLNFIPPVEISSETAALSRKAFRVEERAEVVRAVSLAEIDRGARILVSASIFCNFCKKSLAFIEKNTRLKEIFVEKAVAVSTDFTPKELAAWNSAHAPGIYVAYSKADWAGFDLSATPKYYFLKDGKIVFKVENWQALSGLKLAEGFYKGGHLDFDGYVEIVRYALDSMAAEWESFEDRTAAAAESYRLLAAEMSKGGLRKCKDGTLEKIFYIMADAFMKGGTVAPVRELKAVFRELAGRGLESRKIVENLYDYYMDAREFKDAAALAKKYPGFNYAPIPELEVARGPRAQKRRVYTVLDGGKKAELGVLDPFAGARIVVTGIPVCGATKRAFKDIEKDPRLKEIFAKHAVFITWGSYFRGAAAWNAAHEVKSYVAHLKSDWPEFGIYSSPVFHFVKDGKIIETARGGWGGPDEMAVRLRGLKAIGLE